MSATGNANFLYAATMVHSLGCGLGVLDILGAALRNEVAGRTIQAMDGGSIQSPATIREAGQSRVTEDTDDYEGLKSANRVLEDHNLVIVQYTTLDES